jgi:hypothetical protein
MRKLVTVWMIFALSSAFGQDRSFTVGPVISYDHHLINLTNVNSRVVNYPNSVSYGIDFSFLRNRTLISVKTLTAKRRYSVTDYAQNHNDPNINDPFITDRVEVSAQYYTLPVTVSYQVIKANRLQLFVGAGLTAEWVPSTFKRKLFNSQSSSLPTILPNVNLGSNFVIGGNLQSVVRYQIADLLLLQLEPTFRFFPEVNTPYIVGNRKEFCALLTLAIKLR